MKNLLTTFFLGLSLIISCPDSSAEASISDQQINYLVGQARYFAQQGFSKDQIVGMFEQNLTREELSVAQPNANKRLLLIALGCSVCIGIGCGITYYVMNQKLDEKNGEVTRLTTDGQQKDATIQELQNQVNTLEQQQAARGQNPQNLRNLIRQLGQQQARPQQRQRANRVQVIPDELQNVMQQFAQNPQGAQDIVDFLRQRVAQNPQLQEILNDLESIHS